MPAQVGFDHLALAISHATAPAFMLGAVAGFLSILVGRLERVIDRHRELRVGGNTAVEDSKNSISALLRTRMRLLNRAILFSVTSALVTASLLVVSFLAGLLGLGHGTVVAILFAVALILLMTALFNFAREVRIHSLTMHLE